LLFLPAFVTAKALTEGNRGSPGLGTLYGVARPLPRLALCGFFFASFFRSASTANRRVSRLAKQPEGLGLDAIKPICSILRKMRRKQRKQRDRCRPSGEMTAPRPGRLGRAAARNAGRVAKPPYLQERQRSAKPLGEGGERCAQRICYCAWHKRWCRGDYMTGQKGEGSGAGSAETG
jgi:hypothetical protein